MSLMRVWQISDFFPPLSSRRKRQEKLIYNFYDFLKSAQKEIAPKAKNIPAVSQLPFCTASINANPKKSTNTVTLVHFIDFIKFG